MMLSRQILLADDDVLTQWIMTEVLTQAGFFVVNACRGTEAINMLDDLAEFDLLLTDVDLPGSMTANDLADHWRDTQPGRPVIYTGVQCGPVVRRLEQHEYFMAKPFNAETLLRLIARALEDAGFRRATPSLIRRGQHVH